METFCIYIVVALLAAIISIWIVLFVQYFRTKWLKVARPHYKYSCRKSWYRTFGYQGWAGTIISNEYYAVIDIFDSRGVHKGKKIFRTPELFKEGKDYMILDKKSAKHRKIEYAIC